MSTTETRTIAFHKAFNHPVRIEPQVISEEEARLALKLIEEEFLELADAMFPGITEDPEFLSITDLLKLYPFEYDYKPNLAEIADAVGDLDVVVNGAGIRHGLDMQLLGQEVYESNMSKLGADGNPIYRADGKIQKGPNFREPAIARVLGITPPPTQN